MRIGKNDHSYALLAARHARGELFFDMHACEIRRTVKVWNRRKRREEVCVANIVQSEWLPYCMYVCTTVLRVSEGGLGLMICIDGQVRYV